MTRNVLILCGPEGAADLAARYAAQAGDDLGLVNTRIDPSQVKASGCRIETEREYGGLALATFDEPLDVGAAIAQLVGHADAVVIDRLDDWAGRLLGHFEKDVQASIESALTSVASVMKAQLGDLILLVQPPLSVTDEPSRLTQTMIERFRPLCELVVDARQGEAQIDRGSD